VLLIRHIEILKKNLIIFGNEEVSAVTHHPDDGGSKDL
jgi:hypothetical protein